METKNWIGTGDWTQTRCSHYHSDLDIVAIRFPCCGQFYSCFQCHQELADHPAQTWKPHEFAELAVLCGVCGKTHSIEEYLQDGKACSSCGHPFNPGCRTHRHLYFEFL